MEHFISSSRLSISETIKREWSYVYPYTSQGGLKCNEPEETIQGGCTPVTMISFLFLLPLLGSVKHIYVW
jgi:hypothetical protein